MGCEVFTSPQGMGKGLEAKSKAFSQPLPTSPHVSPTSPRGNVGDLSPLSPLWGGRAGEMIPELPVSRRFWLRDVSPWVGERLGRGHVSPTFPRSGRSPGETFASLGAP